MYLQIFNTKNCILYKISASGLFLKKSYKFRKFQSQYSYKIYIMSADLKEMVEMAAAVPQNKITIRILFTYIWWICGQALGS